MKDIFMQYPFSDDNDNILYDGQEHKIKPLGLYRCYVGEQHFFILRYIDLNYNMECDTILTVINNVLLKYP